MLRISFDEASLVSRSGPRFECHGLGHTLAINRYSGFVYKVSFVSGRGHMTHHGVALPAELHWQSGILQFVYCADNHITKFLI